MVSHWCSRGVDFKLRREDAARISALDAQRSVGKGIYGNGFLLSESAAREAEAAKREAEAAKREAEAANTDDPDYVWELSERERGIVANLGKTDED